jgi:shikimate dehydrogenase
MTKYIDLIGFPLQHSISPVFQQAALDHCKIDGCYKANEIKPEHLKKAIEELRLPHYLGANITVPHKEKVISFLDQVDKESQIFGAVNVIVNKEGKLIGYNTDAGGFLNGLNCISGFRIEGKEAVLLGAGGVARAAGFVLLRNGIHILHVVNRTIERAYNLVRSLKSYVKDNNLSSKVDYFSAGSKDSEREILKSELVVNCTTMGMKYSPNEHLSPLEKRLISPGALVYDLVYNPLQTPLLKLAEEVGARTLSGLPMLIYQGSAAFELWTGITAPVDIMFGSAKNQLTEL